MDEELKPCPFCGQIGELVQDGQWFYVECNNAYCLKADLGESGARETWNTRPIEDALRAENQRLREALEWYANNGHYYNGRPGILRILREFAWGGYSPEQAHFEFDEGRRARAALAGNEEK